MDWFLIVVGLAMLMLPWGSKEADAASMYAAAALLIAGVAVRLLYAGAFA
jgi:hypothetical protein